LWKINFIEFDLWFNGLAEWEIIFEGQKLLGPKGNLVPGESQMKFVAQNYDLMPYATVADNVGKFISNINLKSKKKKLKNCWMLSD
jgi:ABC-type nitrate/sulfonate/bicarbonate transport system ATPase subunit